ncbi:MAG TPA: hypothetical protein PKJ45_08060 [Rubrivivax sp.]|nr:hypothetical protein [Rubrivivax sp.]
MSWQPGQPVRTQADERAWQEWRRESKRLAQRERRANNRRIDYYPDKHAAAAIDALTHGAAGGDYSSVINRIISEWAERCHRNRVPRKC